MCGFAGVIAWDEKYRVSRDTLAKMSAAVAHRGPDGEGMYFSPDAEITPDRPQVALAHRRLAIIDPDPRANQPFTDGEGRWLVYNGEIYNYRELRTELKRLKPEYAWRTDCDTEVLLVAYAVWGAKCVEHFNGMFAFAIWDGVKRELFLARDRMGQKPLYVATAGAEDCHEPITAVAFGSEARVMSPLRWIANNPDPRSLLGYLKWGYVGSLHEPVGEMPPGTVWMYLRRQSASPGPYFKPDDVHGPPLRPCGDTVVATRGLVLGAVAKQLVADVPLGCFLSGGVDSSVIAAAMKHAAGGAPVHTFSIGFDDPRYDEREHGRAVAKHLGTQHHEFVVQPDAATDLRTITEGWGVPFGDSSALPTFYLARETRRHVKVALSGDGGDELFGGYDRYRAIAALERTPRSIRRVLALRWWQKLPGAHPKSRLTRIKRLVATADLRAAERYSRYLRLFDDSSLDALVSGELAEVRRTDLYERGRDWVALQYDWFQQHRDPVEAALATDRVTYLPHDLLTKVDRASMLHALEVRSPFMDHELVQFAAGLTTDQLLKGGPKRMLREAFADDLPAWVFKRKKMGFAVPIGEWFRGELRPMLHDNLFASDSFGSSHFNMNVVRRLVEEHETFKVDHSQRLYALLMLELWWRAAGRARG